MIAAAQIGHAADCTDQGLSNKYLAEHFCAQLDSVKNADESARSITDADVDNPQMPAEWANHEVLRDACRADPKKTLELIARIRKAGGLSRH